MIHPVEIQPVGRTWAIRHNGSYLGYASTYEEALRLSGTLTRLIAEGYAGPPEQLSSSGPTMVR